MSDRPSQVTSTPPGDGQSQDSGWHQPETPGGWKKPAAPQKAEWRTPSQTKSAASSGQGAWHKPKPEETSYTTPEPGEAAPLIPGGPSETIAAEAQIANLPPGVLPFAPEPAQQPVVEQPLPYDETAAPAHPESSAPDAAKAVAAVHQESAAPEEEKVAAAAATAGEGVISQQGQPAGAATPTGSDEEDEVDTFSMGELIALASLVDEGQKPAGSTGPVAPASSSASAQSDAAEYARQQLAMLTGSQTGASAPSAAQPAQAGTSDAADYARRQLEALGQPAAGQPAAAAPAVDAVQEALAEKFLDTEDQVRTLRREYQNGQITREELQSDLRQLMVLDNNQVWWMMGVETDTWYKFDNGQWTPATPPALAQAPAAAPAAPAAPQRQGARGQSLPYLPSEEAVQSGATIPSQPIRTQEDQGMPLPRQVPVRDLEATIPGTQGVYLPSDQQASGVSEPTVPMQAMTDATVRSYPSQQEYQAQQEYYPTVPAPGPQQDVSAPPDYDLQRESPIYQEALKKKRRSNAQLLAVIAVIGIVGFLLLGACGIIAGVLYYRNLAEPWKSQIDSLANYQPAFQTAHILAADGTVLAELTSQQGGARTKVDLSKISPYFIHAVVSTENERFFEDPGWDAIAIARAFIQNFTSGDIQSGASTITQQIARNLVLGDTTPTATRKLQEIVIAAEIAQHPGYDKNFLLQLYLNEVYFGNQSYGIEAAAQFYFGHSAADLNMAESAMLAGLIQAPATYDPVVNREAAFDRMRTVIGRMISVNCLQFQNAPYLGTPFCINPARAGTSQASDPNVLVVVDDKGSIVGGQILIQEAQLVTRNFTARTFQVRYPHFVNFIQAQIENSFGTSEMFRRGFEIHTTLVPSIQDIAQTALQQQLASLTNNGVTTGAVMVTDPRDGTIRAMVGSPNFSDTTIDGQVNNVLTWQQPGSSIKPVEYIGAFEGTQANGQLQYFTPATIIWDVPTTYATNPPYAPVNFDRLFHGPVAVRYALGNSFNIPAIKTFDFIGAAKWQDVAGRLGLHFLPEAQFGLPTAIGADEVRLYDMMVAYGTIANNGQRVPLFAITSITDAAGNDVPVPGRDPATQAIQPQVDFLMQSILTDNNSRAAEFGTSSGLYLPEYPGLVGAKTGTSNDSRDLWTMGFSHNVVVGVWLGRPDNQPTVGTSGIAAVPIWNAVIHAALSGTSPDQFAPPTGVTQLQICATTGTQLDPTIPCPTAGTDWFIQSQPPPPATQGFVQTLQVDTWSGLRANQFCPDSTTTQTFVNISDPFAVPWLNSPDGQATAQALGLTVPVQAGPASQCDASTTVPQVRVVAPTDGQTLQGIVQVTGVVAAQNFNRYQLEVSADGTNFNLVGGPYTNQQTAGGLLGQWDTTTLPNGIYTLRLAVFANADTGGYIYKTVRVGVNNAPPTPIPQPTVVPTFSPIFTPLPFGDTPLAPGAGNPTPTATISFGG